MTRTAALLLLLFAAWLVAQPGARLPRATLPDAPALRSSVVAQPSAEHVVAEAVTLPVAKAPLLSRVPVVSLALSSQESWQRVRSFRLPDRRAALRRVQTRRRLPRMSDGDPPWRRGVAPNPRT